MLALKRRAQTAGFALVEVLIAAGLTAGIGLALSKIVVMGSKGQGAVTAAGDMINLKSAIYLAYTVPTACFYNFGGGNPNPNPNTFTWTGPGAPVHITLKTGLWYPDHSTLVGPQTVTPQTIPVGVFGSGLTVSDLELIVAQQLDTKNYLGVFHVEATKSASVVLGSSTFSADIPVLLGVTATLPYTITSCSTAQATPACGAPPWAFAGTGTSTFCISGVQGGQSVSNAMQACGNMGAHLCLPEEWVIACNTVPGFDSSGGQWVNYNTGCNDPACYDTMGPGCTLGGGQDFSSSRPFRCCHK